MTHCLPALFNQPLKKLFRLRTVAVVIALFFFITIFGKAYAGTITSTATGGSWGTGATWMGGLAPAAGDDVIIANGATVTIDASPGLIFASLTVGQGTSGILQYGTTGAWTLLISGNATIAAGGTLRSGASGTRAHSLSIGGNFTNNGTFNAQAFSTNTITNIFTGSANQTVSGTGGTSNFFLITMSKTALDVTAATNTVEINLSNFTVRGLSTAATTLLTTAVGTGVLKFSGTNTFDGNIWSAVTYTIPSTLGLWLNNPNFIVNGQNGNTTITGLLRVSNGTYTMGTLATNTVGFSANTSTVTIDGGTLNAAGPVTMSAGTETFTVSAGTANLGTAVPTTALTTGANTTVTVNGGTLNTGSSVSNLGFLAISSGILNVGTTSAHNLISNGVTATGAFTISGGAVNIASKFGTTNTNPYNQSGGTLTVAMVPHALVGNAFSTTANSNFTMTGGSIVLQNAGTIVAGPTDYNVLSTTTNITTGILQIGNGSTPVSSIFNIQGKTPNIVLNSFNNPSFATVGTTTVLGDITLNGSGSFSKGNFLLTLSGNSATNPGNITVAGTNALTLNSGTTAALGLTFGSTFANQTLSLGSGSITSGLLAGLTINNTSGTVSLPSGLTLIDASVLTLTNGIVNFSGAASPSLTMGTSALTTLTGGSATSFINGSMARTFAATTVTINNTTLFPIGKGTTYLPVNVGPTVAGVVQLKAEAFTSNSGSNISPTNTVSANRWEASAVSGAGNLTSVILKQTDASIASGNIILKSTSAAGVYSSISPATTYAVGPPANLTSATMLAAEFTGAGYFCYGVGCNPVPVINGPANIFTGAVSQLSATAGTNIPATGVWNSSATGIATVDASGNVTAVAPGSATITLTISSADGCNGIVATTLVNISSNVAPGGVGNNLISWYKGDAGLTTTSWTDQTGTNNLTGTVGSVISNMINFNPVATFNGTSDNFSNANATGWLGTTNANTYMYIATATGGAASRVVYGRGTANGANTSNHGGRTAGNVVFASGTINTTPTTGSWATTPTILSRGGFYGGAGGLHYVSANGAAQVRATAATPTITATAPFYIGRAATAGTYWAGHIAELVAFNGKQTGIDSLRVESYLALKYGISLNQATAKNYMASDGATLMWNASVAGNFKGNIFGIGKDAGSGLDQRVSVSANAGDLLTIATTSNFVLANQDVSRSSLANKNFIVAADNGGTAVWDPNGKITSYAILNRIWKVQATAAGTLNIQFNVANAKFTVPALLSGSSYYIMIDPNADGDYSDATFTALTNTSGTLWSASITISANTIFTLATQFSGTASATAPGGVFNNLHTWLKATSSTSTTTDGSPVSSWGDLTGLGYTFTDVGNAGQDPTYNSSTQLINYNPGLVFDGVNDRLEANTSTIGSVNNELTSFLMSKSITLNSCIIYSFWDNGSNRYFLHYPYSGQIIWDARSGSSTSTATIATPFAAGIPNFSTVTNSVLNAKKELYINGQYQADGNSLGGATMVMTGGATNTQLGASSVQGLPYNGVIPEWIVYNRYLDATETAQVSSYIALKYGITLDKSAGGIAGDYLLSNGTTAWDASDNASYHNDVIGIVRDNISGLLQNQSHTKDDSLRIFVGSLAANNAANTGTITTDVSSIIVGNDKGVLLGADSYSVPTAASPAIINRMGRVWKITNTNFADDYSLEIKWVEGQGLNLADLRLLVSGSPTDFSSASVYTSPDVVFSLGSIIVSGIGINEIPLNSTRYITIASVTSSTLPITLARFDAQLNNNKEVLLSWQTATEQNSSHFGVERSANGNNWETIATVKAAGTSAIAQQYTSIDKNPYSGISYYRLKQVDRDGKFVYSDVRSVRINANGNGVMVYPNPVHNQVTVKADAAALKTLRVYTLTGQDVTGLVTTISNNNSVLVLDVSKLSAGNYTIKTAGTATKMVKQ